MTAIESLIQSGENAEIGVTCYRWLGQVFEFLRLTYGEEIAEDFRGRTDCDNEFDAVRRGIGYLQGLLETCSVPAARVKQKDDAKMDVLISWSGRQSRSIASALHLWLPKVIPPLRPWMSTVDIDKGNRWSNELQNHLAESKGCIVCMTPENLQSPWIYWETGAISLTQKHPICPLLINISPDDIKDGPLAQYQCTFAVKDDVLLLVSTLNQRLDNAEDEIRLRGLFERNWDEFHDAITRAKSMGISANIRSFLNGLEGVREVFRRRWEADKKAASWDPIKLLVTDSANKIEGLATEFGIDQRAKMHCVELRDKIRSITAPNTREAAHQRGDEIFAQFEKAIRAIRADFEPVE